MAIFFAMNMNSNPMYGFSMGAGHVNQGVYWNLNHRVGVGPTGQNAAEIEMIGVVAPTEGYYGWTRVPLTAPPYGTAVYLRVLLRLIGPLDYDGADGTGWGAKFIILGDQGDSNSRFIWNLRDNVGNRSQAIFRIERNIEGPPTRIDTTALPVDEWIWAQVKINSSSAEDVADGRIRLYLQDDNANEATPTYINPSPIVMNVDGWVDLHLGYYGDMLAPGGRAVYQMAGFEYGDTFDPNWRADPSPPPTVNMRYARLRSR